VDRRQFLCAVALLVLVATAGAAAQGQQLEIIPLKHRTVEQVMPALQPLLEPGGTLSGAQNQLFVRTSAKNLAELKAALAALDTAPRRLLISVRQASSAVAERGSASVSGTVGSGRVVISNQPAGAASPRGATARIDDSRTSGENQLVQQVQALEGMPALIQIGQSVPVTDRAIVGFPRGGGGISETTTYREVSSGFEVVARVAGDRAYVDISPRREALAGRGAIVAQQVISTASGRLGEWFELGSITQGTTSQGSEILARSAAERQSVSGIWVKVEEIR